MNRKQQLLVLVGLAVSAIFLWIAFRDLRPEALLDTLREVNPLWLFVGSITYFGAVTL
ncbi:MAG: hypothetical protein H7Y09_10640, partial [Chitinophagaceae bacterium]|nr:hypothetical protein [Anaerolineae bacterium]